MELGRKLRSVAVDHTLGGQVGIVTGTARGIARSFVERGSAVSLAFVYTNEVKDYIIQDHPEHAESFLVVEPHELPLT